MDGSVISVLNTKFIDGRFVFFLWDQIHLANWIFFFPINLVLEKTIAWEHWRMVQL